MKPIEFLTDVGHYNDPAGRFMEAVTTQDLIITDGNSEWEVLSYYWTPKGMCLDIQKKVDHQCSASCANVISLRSYKQTRDVLNAQSEPLKWPVVMFPKQKKKK